MTCCFASAEEREATHRSREIDRYLEKESKKPANQLKLLLLGGHESGKSTFWKQIRILYGKGYSEEDRLQLRSYIYHTVLNGMREVIRCVRKFQIPFQYPESEQNQMFEDWSCDNTDVEFSPYVEPLMSLWRDQGIQEAVKRTTDYTSGYIPSTQDVLHCHTDTGDVYYQVVDVGDAVTCLFVNGDRVRRSGSGPTKRLVFYDPTCILFFVDSNSFDQTLPENGTSNQLKESISLFEQITRSPLFKSTPVILILNKINLLSEKIKKKNIKDYFSNFEGDPHSLDDVKKFLIQTFDAMRPDHTSHYWDLPTSYFMTATDSASVRTVFTEMKDNIIKISLFLFLHTY